MRIAWIALTFSCVAVFSATPVSAAVIEITVPELAGTYVNDYRMATFHLPSLPSVIRGVSVRVRGTTSFSLYSCYGAGGVPGQPSPVPTQVNVELLAKDGTFANGLNHDAPGAFEWTLPLEPLFGATWAFLFDGVGEVGLGEFGEHPIPECFLVGPQHSTTVESVTLLVDGEFATPARPASWGRVKSHYR